VKIDKVYIESERDRMMADEQTLEDLKKFFTDHGVRAAGGITFSDNTNGQFHSFCYTDPQDREFIKRVAELTARHFDEIILDDFFFVTTKYASDIAAKGDRTWTQFRLDLMDEAAENLILKPARAVNPRVKITIKFPNWYEHFQGLGFDLDKEPRLFDGIYTGTETRDPGITDQFLQQYESYQILRYFENIAPGKQRRRLGRHVSASAISTAMPSSSGTRCWPSRARSRSSTGPRCCSRSSRANDPGRACPPASTTSR
jgi:hypothetical protein